MSINTTIIQPHVGADPFHFGMTREQAWAATRSVVTSFFPQQWSTERTDDFRNHAIHCSYEDGVIVNIAAFTSNPPYNNHCPLSLFDQELGPETSRDDILALLELLSLPFVENDEQIDVPSLALTFGFKEGDHENDLRLEGISIEKASSDNAA